MHGKKCHRATEPHVLSALGGCSEKHLGVRKHAAEIAEVMLGDPKRVKAEIFGCVDLLKPMCVKFGTLAVEFRNVSIENVVAKLHG
jgi:hypothetical protein